jgi:adenosylmethionine-8-amino-7-oxononanoate aminotransferase
MSHVFHRQPRHRMPVAVGGDGPWIIDADGRRYLDASGGAAVSCLGHDHPDVVRAIEQQLRQLPYAHTAFFTNEPLEALGEELTAAAPGNLDWAYFVSGGSEAVEAALKLARQYWLERGQSERRRFVARRQSYHGNTLGALAVGGNEWRRRPFEPLLAESHHIAPCYAYREQQADESDADYGRRAADELETALLELGPETVVAFVAETVVGATAGAVPPAPGYFRRIREICDRYGILLILDEVMCGMGRTGTLFACEQEGVVPDMITVAKGLGAGYQPIGALLVSDAIYGAVHDGSGFFQHGHTYMGHASACAGALAVLRSIREPQMLERIGELGASLAQRLHARFDGHPNVGDIRGRGLFRALELVAERDSKTPFPPQRDIPGRVKRAAMEHGLMCYPAGGTIDGRNGAHVLLAPPFIVSDDDLDLIVERLGHALDETVGDD